MSNKVKATNEIAIVETPQLKNFNFDAKIYNGKMLKDSFTADIEAKDYEHFALIIEEGITNTLKIARNLEKESGFMYEKHERFSLSDHVELTVRCSDGSERTAKMKYFNKFAPNGTFVKALMLNFNKDKVMQSLNFANIHTLSNTVRLQQLA